MGHSYGAATLNRLHQAGLGIAVHDEVVSSSAAGFEYRVLEDGRVRISHNDRVAATLRGAAATRFLAAVASGDPQALMARATGNYKRGNERISRNHPRHRNRGRTSAP